MSKLILLIDDEPVILDVATRMLQCGGFDVRTARNGKEAVDILESDPKPDLILSDSNMPMIGGLGLLKHIQDNKMGVPFVMMSSDTEAIERAKEMGAVAGLTKPLDIHVLLATINPLMKG